MAKDKDALRFIEHFSVSNCHWFRNYNESFITSREKNYRRNKLTATEMISLSLVEAELSAGSTAQEIVDNIMIPSIVQVGDLYEKKLFFLPQLMAPRKQ